MPNMREDKEEKHNLKHDLAMALLPTLTVLIVLGVLEAFSRQRLLFASLASSAFLIYLAPAGKANAGRTLVGAQLGALVVEVGAREVLGAGYPAAALAMIAVIVRKPSASRQSSKSTSTSAHPQDLNPGASGTIRAPRAGHELRAQGRLELRRQSQPGARSPGK